MIKSPIIAPQAPRIAVVRGEVCSAMFPKVTMAGAVVKIVVKNIPAKNAPNNSNLSVESSRSEITLVLIKTTAIKTLKKMMAIS